MTTYLLYSDALTSPEMRHEIAEPLMDAVIFMEHEGRRIVVTGILEEAIFADRDDIIDEVWAEQDFGWEELFRDESIPLPMLGPELVFRVLHRTGIDSVSMPPTASALVVDYLRDRQIEVRIEPETWSERRRHKAPWEIEGIERAQRAAETAMLVAARMLREAEPTSDNRLRFEGEILTAEWIRETMISELTSQGTECEQILVHSGDACLRGHDLGTGPILPDTSCIIDVFPRDRRSGVHADMTRTFVPGIVNEEIKRLHEHVRAALDIAFAALEPGTREAYRKVSEYLRDQGFPTTLFHEGDPPLRDGFFHGLGHGVGLEVHERPWMSRRSDDLVDGDVVAVEPGLYFERVGGVRLEDTVLVTSDGVEFITDPYPYDLQP
ncbi:MAG: M24 family metallopeptidase [Actinobacteria bacterium]|nr:M24 family metallopeptidase [Actinomycetota bacterium]